MYDLLGNPSKLDAMKKGIYNRKAGKLLEDLLNTLKENETIIHVHTWTKVLSSAIFAIADKKNIPVFLTVHDYFLTCPNGGCYDYVKMKSVRGSQCLLIVLFAIVIPGIIIIKSGDA